MTLQSQVVGAGPLDGEAYTVLSIDPGKRIGVALWTGRGVRAWAVVMDFEELADWLDAEHALQVIVIEGYRTNPKIKQGGSKQLASQVIGMVRAYARRRGIKLVIQENTILKVAGLHAGISVPTQGHLSDDLSATLHGFYYFESIGMRARDIQL